MKFPKKLFLRFRDAEIRRHELNYLFWECTLRCNLNCLHCGSDCNTSTTIADMPLNDFIGALKTIPRPSKNFTVVMTGGEPLLRNDIEECGKEIRKLGMQWSMVSNGILYTPERHNTLLNAGMGALTISLDGMEDSHNWLRNSGNTFKRVADAIALAASATRLNFDVVSCVTPKNLSQLPSVEELLGNLGVRAWRLFTIAPIGRATENRDLLLNDKQFTQLMEFISATRIRSKIKVQFSCEAYTGKYEHRVRDSYFFCRAGINIGSVLADGSISACPNNNRKLVQGNIYHDNLNQIWETKFQPFRNRAWTKTGICNNCKHFGECLGNGMHLHQGENLELVCCRSLNEKSKNH
ncbi:MAG: TIGR04133 family radical SAM/SPASM protein [Bacteroidales bacterium]|nr:TIGR04133 family radical SAM/SPASM protein [Bacteroidales bacterium]